MILSLIAAVSENGVIGNKGKLPWNLPDDLKHFHDLTVGHPVIMGRKTYESIPEHRRPLRDRLNIVLTRQQGEIPGCVVAHSLEEAIRAITHKTSQIKNDDEAFVIGGAEIYRQALPIARRIYLTLVHATITGDASFPEVDWHAWEEISRTEHLVDDRHVYPFTFLMYERKAPHSALSRGEREKK